MPLPRVCQWPYLSVLMGLVIALVMLAESESHRPPAFARQEGSPQPDLCSRLPALATEPPHTHGEVGTDDHSSPVNEHVHAEPLGSPAPGGSLPSELAAFDLVFIDAIIVHQEGAEAMARLATTRSEHPELITFSRSIAAEHAVEIERLRSWRDDWYPGAPPVLAVQRTALMDEASMLSGSPADGGLGMGPTVMDPAAAMRQLCPAPPPFDLAFIDLMTLHQRTAIAVAELANQRAEHPELTMFGQAVIESAGREIDQLAAWRAAWFGIEVTASPVARVDSAVE